MDRTFTVYRRLSTNAPADQVFAAIEQTLHSTVGGSIQRDHNAFHILNGTNNLNFAFAGDLSAIVTLTQPSPGVIDIHGTITLKPNTLFWICAVGGFFCLWFIWGINLLYFVMNPSSNYQMALDRVQLPTVGNAPPVATYGN